LLPIYQAIEYKETILLGGSTYPWYVILSVKDKPVDYVVKVFNKKQLQQNPAVAKEVYGNILAKEFDLFTPDACLVEFNEEFINSLPDRVKSIIDTKDNRLKFAVKFIDAAQMYLPSSHNKIIDNHNKDLIYAFDNFILNADRKLNKPNILIKGNDFVLIDHELTLSVNDTIKETFLNQNWIYDYKNHIFFHDLKKFKNKNQCFETFVDYIKVLPINKLDSYAKQLRDIGHEDADIESIKNYLTLIKNNKEKFVNILRASIAN